MEEIRASWKKSIFSRMVITFIVVIIPIYGLSLGIYQWSIQTQKEDISNTMLSQVSFYMDSLEKEIMRIKLLQYFCTADGNLQQLASIPEWLDQYEMTQSITQLQQHLQAISNSSAYIKKVSAYLPSIDRVVSSATFENTVPKDEFSVLDIKSYNRLDAQTIYWKDRLFLSVTNLSTSLPTKDNRDNKKPSYIIGVELQMSELRNALKQFNNYEEGGALLIDLQNNFVLTSTNNKEVNTKMTDFVKDAVKTAGSGAKTIKIGGKSYWAIYTTSEYLGITLSKFVPESEVLKRFRKYYIWFWIFTATAFSLIVFYSFTTYRMIYRPLSRLVKSFRKMEKGDLDISITHKKDDEFKYLYVSFNEMLLKLKTLIDQIYKQKILAQNAQLKQLQAQINPHFLYNSFFMLHRMIKSQDFDNSLKISEQLGNYFKFVTRNANENVKLSMEVEHSRIYAEIQALRFYKRIDIAFDELPQAFKDIYVPRLILQPLIENSIEHGLKNIEEKGLVTVRFFKREDGLSIIVEDNGDGVSDEELENLKLGMSSENSHVECTGIINIHRRIQLKFGDESGLLLSRGELGGLKAEILIYAKEEYGNV